MNGQTAQAIVLVANGNAVLAGDAEVRAALTLDRLPIPVLSLAFVRAPLIVATTPAAWIDDLRTRGAGRLALVHVASRHDWLPEHDAVAFAGGVGVMIAADVKPSPELWAGEWRVDPARVRESDPRVWHVVYHAAEPPVPVRADEPAAARWELAHAERALADALEAATAAEGPDSHWTRASSRRRGRGCAPRRCSCRCAGSSCCRGVVTGSPPAGCWPRRTWRRRRSAT